MHAVLYGAMHGEWPVQGNALALEEAISIKTLQISVKDRLFCILESALISLKAIQVSPININLVGCWGIC